MKKYLVMLVIVAVALVTVLGLHHIITYTTNAADERTYLLDTNKKMHAIDLIQG